MKNSQVWTILSAVAGFALLAGCAAQPEQPLAEKPLLLNPSARAQLFQAAQETLEKMHFAIDKLDVKAGVVHTRPLRGAQFFEFWRGDNVGAFNAAEANLDTVRRVVELRVTEQDGRLCVDCDVHVQRLSVEENEVASISQAYQMYSRSTASLQRLELSPAQKESMAWIDLGPDNRLAEKILERIATRIKQLEEEEAA